MREKVAWFLRVAKKRNYSWIEALNYVKSKIGELSPNELKEAKIYFTDRETWLKIYAYKTEKPKVKTTKKKNEIKTQKGNRILILTPFRNEDHSVNLYLESLTSIKYPKNLIEVYWLENDSSDNTLKILSEAMPNMTFKSTTLKSINILGQVNKRKPGGYIKDIPHGGFRKSSWLVIWNDYFLPIIRKSHAKFILLWYADVVAPPEIITEYLKVFAKHPDAGWVGGAMHRRYPRHGQIAFPSIKLIERKKSIVEVNYTGHCWMCPRSALAKTIFFNARGRDIHLSLIRGIKKQNLKVYYQPSIYLKHISTDGKIYKTRLKSRETPC